MDKTTELTHHPFRPKRALIVEDHAALALVLVRVLAIQGVDAEILGNGAEAIVRLRDRGADYGLVWSDVELPGASGWAVLEWVHSRCPDLPMLLVSGADDAGFPGEARRRGAAAAFLKPFSVAEVRQTMAEIFPCP